MAIIAAAFRSTPLREGRLAPWHFKVPQKLLIRFSIHADPRPCARGDPLTHPAVTAFWQVSIHAPARGATNGRREPRRAALSLRRTGRLRARTCRSSPPTGRCCRAGRLNQADRRFHQRRVREHGLVAVNNTGVTGLRLAKRATQIPKRLAENNDDTVYAIHVTERGPLYCATRTHHCRR